MKRFHIALSTNRIEETVADYTVRLGAAPTLVVEGEYALWRTETLNVSIRQDANCAPGELRHLGWEDPAAAGFTADVDVNGVTWERFRAVDQDAEITAIWPSATSDADAAD